jgi:hypothetical protein
LALLDRGPKPVPVALGREIGRELLHEQAPMSEDQDPHRPRGLDEAGGRDRLPGCGGMAEAEATNRSGILLGGKFGYLAVFGSGLLELLFLFILLDGAVAVLGRFLVPGDQLGQHPGERVDLVSPELRARRQARRKVGENALETEHERVADFPLGRGSPAARFHLGERVVERAAPRPPLGEGFRGILVDMQERLTRPGFRPAGGGCQAVRLYRSNGRVLYRFLHRSSAPALPGNEDACA